MRPTGTVQWLAEGEHFVLGRGPEGGGRWPRAAIPDPGEPIAAFPRTDDGWETTEAQFAASAGALASPVTSGHRQAPVAARPAGAVAHAVPASVAARPADAQ